MDPNSSTRPVELIGKLENINKAEQLIKDVIAEVQIPLFANYHCYWDSFFLFFKFFLFFSVLMLLTLFYSFYFLWLI